MKNILFSVPVLISIFFMYSCGKEDIILIYPKGADILPLQVEFLWDASASGPVNLKIRKTGDDQVLVDTTLSAGSLIVNKLFFPDTEYEWTVKSDKAEATANFSTMDVLGEFEGIYEFFGERSCNGYGNVPPCDTTLTTQIELQKNGEKLILKNDYLDWEWPCWLRNDMGGDTDLLYFSNFNGWSFVSLNLANDSINIHYRSLGQVAWMNWVFRGKKN